LRKILSEGSGSLTRKKRGFGTLEKAASPTCAASGKQQALETSSQETNLERFGAKRQL
jgi:hypothetical protein